MKSKKVTRYYSDCGRGFWKKQKALNHEQNCTCWKNPKFRSCLSCVHKCIVIDHNDMEVPYRQTWQTNLCKFSDSGIPVHPEFDFIRKKCKHYLPKTS